MDNKDQSMMKNELIAFEKENIDDIIGFKTSMSKAERFALKKNQKNIKLLEKMVKLEPEILSTKTNVNNCETQISLISKTEAVQPPGGSPKSFAEMCKTGLSDDVIDTEMPDLEVIETVNKIDPHLNDNSISVEIHDEVSLKQNDGWKEIEKKKNKYTKKSDINKKESPSLLQPHTKTEFVEKGTKGGLQKGALLQQFGRKNSSVRVVEDTINMNAMNKKLCNSVITGEKCLQTEKGKLCTFAHDVNELRPDSCNFGSECYRVIKINDNEFKTKNEIVCRLLHDKESMESYIKRVGYDKFAHSRKPKIKNEVITKTEICKTPQVKPNVHVKNMPTSSGLELTIDSESFKITVPSEYALQALAIAIEKGKKNVIVNMI